MVNNGIVCNVIEAFSPSRQTEKVFCASSNMEIEI